MESESRSKNIIRQDYVKEHMGHDLANRKHFLLFDLHIYWLAYRRIRCLLIQFNEMKDDHRCYMQTFAVAKRKPERISGLYGIRTLDLCDTGAALYQLS